MTFRQNYTPSVQELRALVTCGDLGSVSRAAVALNLTQSAVSRSIRSLEERSGVLLFHRVRKRLHLSDAGRAMVRESRDILERMDSSARMIMAFGCGGDVLRLGVLPTFAANWLIPRLPEFLALHPEISIDIAPTLHLPDIFTQQALSSGALHRVHPSTLSGPTPYALIRPVSQEISSAVMAFTDWLSLAAQQSTVTA